MGISMLEAEQLALQDEQREEGIQKALDIVLKHEGGYTANRNDRGNYTSKGKLAGTKYGISARVYESAVGKEPTAKDIKNLTKEEAKEIYRTEYVRPITDNLGVKPTSPVFPQVLDMAINHGYSGAVAIVQRALGVKVDGKAGPATQTALQNADLTQLNDSLVDQRIAEYERIVKSDPAQKTFEKGWAKRAESFRTEPKDTKENKMQAKQMLPSSAQPQSDMPFADIPASQVGQDELQAAIQSVMPNSINQISPASPYANATPNRYSF